MRAGEGSELAPILFRSVNKAIRQRVGKAKIIAVVSPSIRRETCCHLYSLAAVRRVEFFPLIALRRDGAIEQGQHKHHRDPITAHCLAPSGLQHSATLPISQGSGEWW